MLLSLQEKKKIGFKDKQEAKVREIITRNEFVTSRNLTECHGIWHAHITLSFSLIVYVHRWGEAGKYYQIKSEDLHVIRAFGSRFQVSI